MGHIFTSKDKIAPARTIAPGHWEFRMPDSMCSPHLQLVAILATGLEGIGQKMRLDPTARTWKTIEGMSNGERKEAGIKSVPRSLEE